VTGIGGFFFRSRDPGALAAWYQERLGVKTVPESYEEGPWRQEAGETVFAPFAQDSQMIGSPEHTWMINFRVEDLDAMVEQLRGDGRGRPDALSERLVRRAARSRGKRHPALAAGGRRLRARRG
jgi:hypothetical protein